MVNTALAYKTELVHRYIKTGNNSEAVFNLVPTTYWTTQVRELKRQKFNSQANPLQNSILPGIPGLVCTNLPFGSRQLVYCVLNYFFERQKLVYCVLTYLLVPLKFGNSDIKLVYTGQSLAKFYFA